MTAKRGGTMGARSESSNVKVRRTDDMWRAWKLFRGGMTYRDISRILECSLGKAHSLVKDARDQITTREREDLVTEITERQRALISSHWRTRKDPDSAKVIHASDKLLVSIFGLETKRTELTGKDGAPLMTVDVTSLSHEQLEALARGDLSGLAGESGAGAPKAPGSSDDESG
jgi:hypothetical protein